ncbi:hypothetical protein PHYBLDRAFT_72612 [Phycomyces blakesleeanus NRRL 1555(-)]|uniref:Uncharacterized protein n=1 Tax=Phycomyces blakesleeanus (strain ATCC 8743b / DSM 1359 / FGSC 10004 / NBRC 33097 / NRRL 1555) TaxID=763407 RepID=A0A167REP4_PHYB8|nr:hypothetical protein PHYBLDRAFT_72612 [Phycomyces blakesleeanus NRRL 1555(-)]OAD81477.1 hypothetical protein PHYBLDRAFT_72612 [Phycomyces blakesleeanus NRRL 1555(-)]|eukprot:XP_018299517.1 hypothetical protein PHYBLDRAFT_72612 [Phycomyces blakesleeanus NRRL 1555(-)]
MLVTLYQSVKAGTVRMVVGGINTQLFFSLAINSQQGLAIKNKLPISTQYGFSSDNVKENMEGLIEGEWWEGVFDKAFPNLTFIAMTLGSLVNQLLYIYNDSSDIWYLSQYNIKFPIQFSLSRAKIFRLTVFNQ